ncbi:hypothetical protein Tco_0066531 [Tanacetum coccineum]
MSDSEHSTVTYTSVSEDDSDIGSPGVDGPHFYADGPFAYINGCYKVPPSLDYHTWTLRFPVADYIHGPEGPPSPDYVPGPEEPEQAPPSPFIYLIEEQRLHAATHPNTESPGYFPKSESRGGSEMIQ